MGSMAGQFGRWPSIMVVPGDFALLHVGYIPCCSKCISLTALYESLF